QIVTELSQIKHRARAVSSAEEPESVPRSSAGPAVARVLLFAFLALLVLETILAWQFGAARTVVPPETLAPKPRPSVWRIFDPRNIAYFPLLLVIALGAVLIHEAATDEFLGFLPSGWRSAIEHTLGVPEAAAGEGTRWKLDYMAYLTGANGADHWLAFGLILGAAVLAFAVYRAERVAARVRVPGENTPSSRPFWPLAGMRFGLLLLTLVVFLPQLRLFFEREGWPDVVILIDTSRSMSKPDDYQDDKVKSRAGMLAAQWRELAAPLVQKARRRIDELQAEKIKSPSADRLVAIDRELAEQNELLDELNSDNRLNLIKALVAGMDGDWVTALLNRRQVKVHVYQCSTKSVRLAEVIDSSGAATAVDAVRELRPLGESSQLGGAVRAVLNDFRGGSLGAIVMLTDGVTTEGDDLLAAGRHAARADVPLFFVGLGDAHEPRDLVLHDLQAEDSVNLRDRLVFDIRVSVKGNLKATSVPVRLSEKDHDGKLTELERKDVSLDPGKPVKVRLTTTPTEPGHKTYVVTADVQPDETDPTNNRVEKAVHVSDAKPVKLLYVEGRPRYEFRFLKTLLEREQATKRGNKSITLKTLLLDADWNFPAQDKTALAAFPSREELFAFDAVILGDVDPKHSKIGERNLQLLRDFVREKGGGLLFLAGEDFMPQAYRETPLADVLPVIVAPGDAAAPGERAFLEFGLVNGYRPTLTAVGQQHPIFRFATDDAQNAAIWSQLPRLMWAASGYRVKPAGEVLAVHPQLPARRGNESADSELHPLVVQQFVGAGRAMFFGFDETWRWRFREFEPRFNQFWLQTVSYLARTRVGRVEIRLDKQTPYRRNEPIRVTVRFPDDQPAPAEGTQVKVLVERSRLRRPGAAAAEGMESQSLLLTKVKGSRATFEALLTRTPEGEYKFRLAVPVVEGMKPLVECRVLPPLGELDRLRMNQSEMELAAKESRGKFYTLADAESLVDELPAGTRVSLNQPRPPWLLWNHAALFALALGLLTSEWVLRKRRRLL
ncbi:MAG: VWA domain-containing protein, partial [Gemmataceae bacterium]